MCGGTKGDVWRHEEGSTDARIEIGKPTAVVRGL